MHSLRQVSYRWAEGFKRADLQTEVLTQPDPKFTSSHRPKFSAQISRKSGVNFAKRAGAFGQRSHLKNLVLMPLFANRVNV